MLKTQSQKKADLVREILANETYLPKSGLYRQVEERLLGLSSVTLGQLLIIIKCRGQEND